MEDKQTNLCLLDRASLSYGDLNVLKGFTLDIPKGKITAVVGPSGCGKSSILNLLAGLKDIDEGHMDLHDQTVGYVFQEDRLLPWETVYNNVRLVRKNERYEDIMAILRAVELDGFANKYPSELSGGMRQRCAIARAFYYHATLLLMDEPFKSLDYDLRLNLGKYLLKLWEKSKNTILLVTHDIDEALLLSHQVLVLSDRPASIVAKYVLDQALSERHLTEASHLKYRQKIMAHLSGEEISREES